MAAMTEFDQGAFLRAWTSEYNEWCAILDDMIVTDGFVSAYDVSEEQRRRMAARGEESVHDTVRPGSPAWRPQVVRMDRRP
jgi:hypothetical protein